MLPTLGQGGCLALEDAVAIGTRWHAPPTSRPRCKNAPTPPAVRVTNSWPHCCSRWQRSPSSPPDWRGIPRRPPQVTPPRSPSSSRPSQTACKQPPAAPDQCRVSGHLSPDLIRSSRSHVVDVVPPCHRSDGSGGGHRRAGRLRSFHRGPPPRAADASVTASSGMIVNNFTSGRGHHSTWPPMSLAEPVDRALPRAATRAAVEVDHPLPTLLFGHPQIATVGVRRRWEAARRTAG